MRPSRYRRHDGRGAPKPRAQRLLLTWACLVLGVLALAAPSHAGRLTVVTSEEPPTNFTRNGELTGIVTDVVRAILDSLHQKESIEVYPWARAYRIASSEPDIVIFTAARTQERVEHGFAFVGPVTTRQHTLYGKAGRTFAISSIEDLKRQKLRVGAMRGDWRGKFLMDQGVSVEEVTAHPQNIKKLLAGHIDLFALSDLELGENIKLAGASMSQVGKVYVLQERDAYILLSAGTSPKVVAQWQQAFMALRSTDFFKRSEQKWSAYLGVPLHYTAEKGFHIQQ